MQTQRIHLDDFFSFKLWDTFNPKSEWVLIICLGCGKVLKSVKLIVLPSWFPLTIWDCAGGVAVGTFWTVYLSGVESGYPVKLVSGIELAVVAVHVGGRFGRPNDNSVMTCWPLVDVVDTPDWVYSAVV